MGFLKGFIIFCAGFYFGIAVMCLMRMASWQDKMAKWLAQIENPKHSQRRIRECQDQDPNSPK